MVGHSNCCERKRKSVLIIQCLTSFFADINEYKAGKYKCAPDANCQNTKGSFVCTCKPGYSGDGVSCTGENNTSVFFTKNLFLINSSYVALKPSSAKRQYEAQSPELQLVLLRLIISMEMPLHTAIVCDLQYLYAISAIFELTRACVLKLCEVRSLLI